MIYMDGFDSLIQCNSTIMRWGIYRFNGTIITQLFLINTNESDNSKVIYSEDTIVNPVLFWHLHAPMGIICCVHNGVDPCFTIWS